MKAHARAVVIGGGIAGCSVAFHLAEKGWRDVVLVDKTEGTPLEVEVLGERLPAAVAPDVLYDPSAARVRS